MVQFENNVKLIANIEIKNKRTSVSIMKSERRVGDEMSRHVLFFMSPQLNIGAKKFPLRNGGLSSYYVTPVLYSGHD